MNKPLFITRFEYHVLRITKQISVLLGMRYGIWILGIISFVESALLLPIITDPFLVAYILAHRTHAVRAVIITTTTSIFGGFIAFITAAFFLELIMQWTSDSTTTQFYQLVAQIQDSTFVLAFLGAVTPIPFTLVALAAGAIKGNLVLFLLGGLVGRLLRYGVVGFLTYKFGEKAVSIVKERITLITILTFIACGLYFYFVL